MLVPLAHGWIPHVPVRPSSNRRPFFDSRHAQGLAAASGTALAARRRQGLVKGQALHKSGQVLSSGTVPVDGYELYYEEHGSKEGLCVVFLHGGPGAGSSRRMAQLFDPAKYRVILFDQRGLRQEPPTKHGAGGGAAGGEHHVAPRAGPGEAAGAFEGGEMGGGRVALGAPAWRWPMPRATSTACWPWSCAPCLGQLLTWVETPFKRLKTGEKHLVVDVNVCFSKPLRCAS